MQRFFYAAIVSIAFLFLLEYIDSSTSIGNIILAGAETEGVIASFQSQDTCNLAAQIIQITNAARARGARCPEGYYPPARAVQPHPTLMQTAQMHSEVQAKANSIFHSSGGSLRSTAGRVGAGSITENAWLGNTNPLSSVQGFLTSKKGHCGGMMGGRHRYIGVGVARGNRYWHVTQQFV